MSLFTAIKEYFVKREVKQARAGKRGAQMQKFLAALDGWKRVITLVVFIVAAWVQVLGHGDYSGHVGAVLALLDWQAPEGFYSLVVATAGGVVAIGHAVKKAIDESRAKADTVTVPKV